MIIAKEAEHCLTVECYMLICRTKKQRTQKSVSTLLDANDLSIMRFYEVLGLIKSFKKILL